MTLLPIVVRELRVAARRRSTFRVRFSTACVAAGVCGYLILVSKDMMGRPQGGLIFSVLASICFLTCLSLSGNTVDCISDEKREGTLGFLFLTDLKGHDIALGKLFSSSLISFYALMSMFPVGAICLLLGGVSATAVWQAALALLNVFFFSQCVGLFVSAFTVKRATGAGLAGLILGVYTLGFFLASLGLRAKGFAGSATFFERMNPGYCVHRACTMGFVGIGFGGQFNGYWSSLLLVHLNAWLFLALASAWLPHSWQQKTARLKIGLGERLRHHYHSMWTPRARLLDKNPFLWLTVRNQLGSVKIWIALITLGGFWLWLLHRLNDREALLPVFIGAIVVNHLVLRIMFAADVTSTLEEQKRNGGLELLLSCTPLSVEGIIEGQWMALRRRYLGPVAVALAVDFFMVFSVCMSRRVQDSDSKANFVAFVAGMAVMLIVDLAAIGWLGMWQAMSQKKPRHAAGATIFRILIMPWVIILLLMLMTVGGFARGIHSFPVGLMLWLIFGIALDFVSMNISKGKLMTQFRDLSIPHRDEPLGFFGSLGKWLGGVNRGRRQ
jgi:hypothetical protein